MPRISVVIPAVNEATSIGLVLGDLPAGLAEVVVVDNGSTDDTAAVARAAGATVVREDRKGYGSACLAGIEYLRRNQPPEILVFIDGDYSDHPEELPLIVGPILADEADLVIGSRVTGQRERGALLPQALFGNQLATALIRLMTGVRFTDLGPFRAVRWSALEQIRMVDTTFGWTVEMQLKAAQLGLRCVEVPVRYRRRVGVSKITGTLSGTVRAGYKILYTLARYGLRRR